MGLRQWLRDSKAGRAWHRLVSGMRRWEMATLIGFVGFVIGFVISIAPDLKRTFADQVTTNEWILVCSLTGAVIGFCSVPAWHWLLISGRSLEIEQIEIPWFGTITVKVTDENRVVGWKIFVEAATRITTQSLHESEGLLREALSSMYEFFKLVRGELKVANPSPPLAASDGHTLESYALLMLNDALRPMLARWHPRLSVWEKTGRPESEWPLAAECRSDLETARQLLLGYTWGLGELFNVAKLETLLPVKPQGGKPSFLTDQEISQLENETGLDAILSDTQRPQSWHIFVEAATRIASQSLGKNDGVIREALDSLYKLFEIVRTELKDMLPAASAVASQSANASADTSANLQSSTVGSNSALVVSYAMGLLNDALRPMLARWHPRLSVWEKTGRPESEWPLAAECRSDLEITRKRVLSLLWGIGERLKLPDLRSLLPEKPTETEAQLCAGWISDDTLTQSETAIRGELEETLRSVGWRIFVELASRIATQPLQANTGSLHEALDSLHELYGIIRDELKKSPPLQLEAAKDGDTVEAIALDILNGPLRQFLATWHPRLPTGGGQNNDESEWTQAEQCRADLEKVRADIAEKAKRLGTVIGLRGVARLLAARQGNGDASNT
jgi:hypothetical protein